MCGILGVVAKQGSALDLTDSELVAMRDTMFARGPDEAGLVRIENRAAMAHRRLSIRDPDQGQQPWISDDGRYTLTYNGELYNTDELEKVTAAHFSEPLQTHCDTELLMRLFQVYGAETPRYLRGMFACGFYDSKLGRLTLLRDRFGIKPLYYACIGNEFIFASSPAAILKHPRFVAEPYWPAITHYLQTLRTTFDDKTPIKGIHQVPAGCLLQLDEAGLQISRYWNYPRSSNSASYRETLELFEQVFSEAVSTRMVSDVPVGMMLSGGVDSSLLGVYVRKNLGRDFVAECGVGNNGYATDDETYAKIAAGHLGCRFQTVSVDEKEYRESWAKLIRENGLPLATPSDVIIYHLARSLKEKVGVVLGGEGADELLCGYSALHGAGRDYDLLRQIAGEPASISPALRKRFADSFARTYRTDSFSSLAEHYFALASLIPPQGISMLLNSGRNHEEEMIACYRNLLKQVPDSDDQAFSSSPGLGGMIQLLHRVNLETLLARLDRSTMAASLEARVPFTDHHLVERIWPTPFEHRFRVDPNSPDPYCSAVELDQRGELQTKRILRDLASRTLPEELAFRKKQSFPTPVASWLQDPWRQWSEKLILQNSFMREYFQRRPLQELVQNPQAAGMWIWPLLNLALWSDEVFR